MNVWRKRITAALTSNLSHNILYCVTPIWTMLERFPPCAVRLLARKRGRNPIALSDVDLMRASGLALSTIRWLSVQTSWDDVSVADMRRFAQACGADFGDRRRMKTHSHYLAQGEKRPGLFTYLRKSPDWEAIFLPILKTLYASTRATPH